MVVSSVNPNEPFHSSLRDRLVRFKRAPIQGCEQEWRDGKVLIGAGHLLEKINTRIYSIVDDTMCLIIEEEMYLLVLYQY